MGLRGKILFVLIVYFAGFVTAIYAMAPVSAKVTARNVNEPVSFPQSFTKSDQFAKSFGERMRKCLNSTKDFAQKAKSSINTGSAPAADKG